MFISGFFFNGLVLSIFFITNGIDYSVTCDTNAHYIEKGPLCLFQAAFLIFLYIWVEIWSLIFAYDMYLHISSSVTAYDIPTLRYRYMLVAVTLSCVITAIPVFANNIGFDPEANVPFCMYMLSENKNYFWYIFMLPLMALLILATGYAIMGTVRMNEIFVGATSSSGRNKLTLSHAGSLSLSVSQAAGDEYLLNTAIDDSNDVGASSSRGIPSQGDSIKSAATSEQPLYHPPISDAQCLSITNSSQQDYLNQVVSIYQSYETGGGCDNYSHGYDYGNPYVQFHDGGSDCGSEAYFPPPPPEDEEWPQRSGTSSYLSSQYSASRGAEYRDGANEDASFSVFSTVSDILTMGNPVLNQGLEAEYSPLAAQEEVLLQQGREGSPSSVHSKQFRSESGGQSFHTGSGSSQSQSHHTHSSDPISFASRAQSNTTSNARSSQRLAAYYNSSRSSFQRSINSWRLFIKATWKYNGLSIVFVLTFCLSTLVIGPFLFFLDHVWWSRAVEAGQEFTECLVQASMISPDQTQTGVDSYAREVCGAVPGHRPNQIMVSLVASQLCQVLSILIDTIRIYPCCVVSFSYHHFPVGFCLNCCCYYYYYYWWCIAVFGPDMGFLLRNHPVTAVWVLWAGVAAAELSGGQPEFVWVWVYAQQQDFNGLGTVKRLRADLGR